MGKYVLWGIVSVIVLIVAMKVIGVAMALIIGNAFSLIVALTVGTVGYKLGRSHERKQITKGY